MIFLVNACLVQEDDIFATPSTTSATKRKKAATKDESLFKDDTDIFADIPAAKPKEKKGKKKTKGGGEKSMFKDDVGECSTLNIVSAYR